MFVVTIDQRGSRTDTDRVPALLSLLRGIPTRLPFERTVGDEVQGVLAEPGDVVTVVLRALRDGHWHVGVGTGAVQEPLPARSPEASGDAFVAARAAVDRAKKSGERVPLAVRTGGSAVAEAAAAEAVLILIGDVVRRRTESEWRVVDALADPATPRQIDVAKALEISPQAVSKALLRTGWVEERQGAHAARLLLGLCRDGATP